MPVTFWKRSCGPVSKTTELIQSERGIQQLLYLTWREACGEYHSLQVPSVWMRAAARCSWTLTRTWSPATEILQQTCRQEDATVLETASLHNTTDHTHTPRTEPELLSWEQKRILLGKKSFLIHWEEKSLSRVLQLGRDPVSCQHQCGWSGAENGPGQGQTWQEWKQVSKPVLQSYHQHTGHWARSGCGVTSQRCQVQWGPSFASGLREQEDLFFLCLAHHYSSFSLGSDIIFSVAPRPVLHSGCAPMCSHHPAVLPCSTPNWSDLMMNFSSPAAREHKADSLSSDHCIPVHPATAACMWHIVSPQHLTGRKERWIKPPKESRGLEEGQEENIEGGMRSFILF